MASLIRELVPLILVREDDRARHGVQTQGVVVLPYDRADGEGEGGEVYLV
jgi:hypothetical protein